jgi:predicted transposase YbfD/YdcC
MLRGGATVTTDAMGTQYKIGEQIVEAKGDYLLALKGNQGEFHDDIKLYFDSHLQDEFSKVNHSVFSHVSGDHGRIEMRKVWLITNVGWLVKRHPKWKTLRGITMIESWREMNGKETYEQRYYITSHHDKSAEFIAKGIRSHWYVENKLHWQLDVSFNEDSNRLRSGDAAKNFALMNKIALNLLENEKSIKLGVKNKRLKAGWDNDYMLKVLTVGLTIV